MPEFREHISCQELVELTSDYIETIRAERMLREEGAPEETLAPIISTFRERRQS